MKTGRKSLLKLEKSITECFILPDVHNNEYSFLTKDKIILPVVPVRNTLADLDVES